MLLRYRKKDYRVWGLGGMFGEGHIKEEQDSKKDYFGDEGDEGDERDNLIKEVLKIFSNKKINKESNQRIYDYILNDIKLEDNIQNIHTYIEKKIDYYRKLEEEKNNEEYEAEVEAKGYENQEEEIKKKQEPKPVFEILSSNSPNNSSHSPFTLEHFDEQLIVICILICNYINTIISNYDKLIFPEYKILLDKYIPEIIFNHYILEENYRDINIIKKEIDTIITIILDNNSKLYEEITENKNEIPENEKVSYLFKNIHLKKNSNNSRHFIRNTLSNKNELVSLIIDGVTETDEKIQNSYTFLKKKVTRNLNSNIMNSRRSITLYTLLKNIKKFFSSYYVFINLFENFDKVCILYYEKSYTDTYRNRLYFVFIKYVLLKMEKIYGNENKIYGNENKMLKGLNNDMLLKELNYESKQKIFENRERIFILEEMNKKEEVDIHNLYTRQNYEIIQEIIKYYLIDNLLEESYITEILENPIIVNIVYFLCISINENVCPNKKEKCQVIKRTFIIKLLNKTLQIKEGEEEGGGEGEEEGENKLNKYTYSGIIKYLYYINTTFSNDINIISKNYSIILFYIKNKDKKTLRDKINEIYKLIQKIDNKNKNNYEKDINRLYIYVDEFRKKIMNTNKKKYKNNKNSRCSPLVADLQSTTEHILENINTIDLEESESKIVLKKGNIMTECQKIFPIYENYIIITENILELEKLYRSNQELQESKKRILQKIKQMQSQLKNMNNNNKKMYMMSINQLNQKITSTYKNKSIDTQIKDNNKKISKYIEETKKLLPTQEDKIFKQLVNKALEKYEEDSKNRTKALV